MTHTTVYSTKILKGLAILMLTAFTFVSCKKDNDLTPQPSESQSSAAAEGLYTGKYGFGTEIPENDQKYRIKQGGVFQEIGVNSGTVIGEGNWSLNGNTLTASYTIKFAPFSKYSIIATLTPTSGKLVGTWGGEHDPTDGGKIDMTRQ